MSAPLTEKYRPRRLAGLLGQPWPAQQLEAFASNPYPCAFLFSGDTGTGKTTAAHLLAEALGVAVAEGPFGGLYEIASGEQTGETVRKTTEGLRCRPFYGSGWRLLVVNEADAMTPNAAFVWLDALEGLPARTVVVFTTNAAGKIPSRLRDRCECLHFEASALLLGPELQALTDRVWRDEGCRGEPPAVESLGVADGAGNASFRRLLQKLQPLVRAGASPAAAPAPASAGPDDRLHFLGRRWASGEAIKALAGEAGCSWNRLHADLSRLGYKKGA